MELFGLRSVPSWGAVLRGWRHQSRHYGELLAQSDLTAAQRLGWRLYSIPYALAETAAQYLGAREAYSAPASATIEVDPSRPNSIPTGKDCSP